MTTKDSTDWEKRKETLWNEISQRVSINATDWPWIRAAVYALVDESLAEHTQRIREQIGEILEKEQTEGDGEHWMCYAKVLAALSDT